MPFIKALTSLNFSQIGQMTTELAALERLKDQCFHFVSVAIDPILFKLADQKMHNFFKGVLLLARLDCR